MLIADKNPAVVEGLASVLQISIPSIALNLCRSHSDAVHRLTTVRYQVVLCGVQFAAARDFLLLKQHRVFQPAVPILLLGEREDYDLVQRALEREQVEDIVVWPLLKDYLQTSVRDAMSLYRTRLTMADRRARLSILRSGHSLPPKQTHRAIRRVEANVKDLARVVADCEREAQKRVIEHFDLLGRVHVK